MLCELLTRTGVAGTPTEYFLHSWQGQKHSVWILRGSILARGPEMGGFEEFLTEIRGIGTAGNGVFGAKLPWNSADAWCERLATVSGVGGGDLAAHLVAVFDAPRLVHLFRRDRVAQAVSWAFAAETGCWSSVEGRKPLAQEPTFDVELLDGLVRLIREGEAGWRDVIGRTTCPKLEVASEELSENPGLQFSGSSRYECRDPWTSRSPRIGSRPIP
ncbi:MAG: hypothetical protein GY910_11680 [bacterium]|nr:hypothetical protein [bacterium]